MFKQRLLLPSPTAHSWATPILTVVALNLIAEMFVCFLGAHGTTAKRKRALDILG